MRCSATRLSTAAVFLVLLASLGVPAPSSAQERDTLPPEVMGFSLGPFAQRQETMGVELDRMQRVGTNTVTVTVWWDADQERSVMAPTRYTKTDAEIRLAMRAIRQRGLAVAMLPLFTCSNCENTWRGAIKPSNKTVFYESYRAFVERYAAIAEEEGAALVFIGSEMSSLQGDTAEWRNIAAGVRSKFSGSIAYDVNWDAVDGVRFWDAVDIPSISAYFPLSEKRHPTLETLKKAWLSSQVEHWRGRNSVAEVQKLATRTGKKVLFGEAGYRSRDWATRLPFDYAADDGDPNPALQADAYQALLETFYDKPYWRGVLWWEWELNSPQPSQEKTFTPRGKPAEEVLRAWYVEGIRPNAQSPRLADRSAQTGSSGRGGAQPGSGGNSLSGTGGRSGAAQPGGDNAA
ncbi:MAG: glycoside hydrolase family 113, partial [Acidimicrobiia bacterium]